MRSIAHPHRIDVYVQVKKQIDETTTYYNVKKTAFPIDFCLTATMSWCDPKCPATKSLWLVAFTISMAWLALFSYVMVTVADTINVQFGITQAILGVTLCAAGTSFPNLWASYLTAREGKSSMAVANALGSNVQNVFLALALPWTVKTFFAEGNFIPMATPGIMDGVVWMAMLKGPALVRGQRTGMVQGLAPLRSTLSDGDT